MEPIRKAILSGLGALSVTNEKAGEIIDDLVKRGEMSEEEGAAQVDHLLKEARRQEKEFEGKVATAMQKVLSDMGLLTRKDFQTLSGRLDRIEAKLGKTRKGKRGTKA